MKYDDNIVACDRLVGDVNAFYYNLLFENAQAPHKILFCEQVRRREIGLRAFPHLLLPFSFYS